MGLQYKTADELGAELDLPTTQLLGLFNRTIRKISQFLSSVVEQEMTAELESVASSGRSLVPFVEPITQTLSQELEEDAKVIFFSVMVDYVWLMFPWHLEIEREADGGIEETAT